MRDSNIHTHTTFSDGKNTVEEMIQRAIELSFASIGISDHSETAFDSAFCMGESFYDRYRREIAEMKKRYEEQISVFCGLEQDCFSPNPAEGFDYVIGSVHHLLVNGENLPVDLSLDRQKSDIEKHLGGDPMEYARRYFHLVGESAVKGGYQVQGHLDLLNKFGLFDNSDETYRSLALQALEAVCANIPYLEMNTGAISRGYKALYPATFLLEACREKGVRIVLNGDSHSAAALDCHFKESKELLKKVSYSSLWQLRREGWTELSL